MKVVVLGAGIIVISTAWHLLERGITCYHTNAKSFDTAGDAAALMRKYGVERRVVRRFCTAMPQRGLNVTETL